MGPTDRHENIMIISETYLVGNKVIKKLCINLPHLLLYAVLHYLAMPYEFYGYAHIVSSSIREGNMK